MKKFIYIFIALFLGISQANAQEIYIENFTAPEGGVKKFDVKYKGIGDRTIMGYIFKFEFPEGLSLATDDKGKVIFEYGEGNDNFDVKTTATGVQASPSDTDSKLVGESGTLMTLTLKVTDPLKMGDNATVNVFAASLTEKVINEDTGLASYNDLDTDPFTFEVEIGENITVLDENDTEAPKAAENVKVQVLRTINANSWSTICLPFAMTEDQVVEAFKDDVKIAEFTGCAWDEDAMNIMLDFTSKSTKNIEANHPYLIKVSEAITHDVGFTADKVTIAPVEEPIVEVEGGDAAFIGTYEKLDAIGSNRKPVLFIAQNQFWFSKGTASLKPYRGYFDIDGLKDFVGNAKVGFFVDDEATAIDNIGMQRIVEGVYDLSGRKIQIEGNDLNNLQKGVYIIDGKKVTIK